MARVSDKAECQGCLGARAEMLETIRKEVREGVTEALRGVGLDTEDHAALQADFVHLRKARKGAEDMGRLVRGSVMTTLIGGGLWMLWEGIKHAIKISN